MAKYAARADHDRHYYEVYEIATGKGVKKFSYRSGSESSRAKAAGLATLTREAMNREARNRAA